MQAETGSMLILFDGAAAGGGNAGGGNAGGGDGGAGAGGAGGGNSGGGSPSLLGGGQPAAAGTSATGTGSGTSAVGQEQGFKLPENWDWRTALPETMRENATAKKYATLEELVRGADHAQQMIGKDPSTLVEIKDGMTDEQRQGVFHRLGLPKDPAEYKVAAPKDGGDLLQIDHPNFKTLAGTAHKLGILPNQFQGLLDIFGKQVAEGQKNMIAQEAGKHAKNIEGLKAELGEAFDLTVGRANDAIKALGETEEGVAALQREINEAGLGTSPALLKALAKVGAMLDEEGGGGDKGGSGGPRTPSALLDEARKLTQQSIDEKNPVEARRLQLEAQKIYQRVEDSKKKG